MHSDFENVNPIVTVQLDKPFLNCVRTFILFLEFCLGDCNKARYFYLPENSAIFAKNLKLKIFHIRTYR